MPTQAQKISQTSPAPKGSSTHVARPPVVVVMGHVDHGKTSLLDHIRKANVASREAGGITQAVGAYEIDHAGRKITFIDTPGHEAFTAMRSRGANIADLAILVIAADEGVKPQTKEAIKIIEESKTPFIVAINKVDKTGGNLDKARNDLMSAGVLLEGYGGQVSYHGISAKTGEGVNDLLDLILLTADVEDLNYDPTAPASGYILEARRDPRRGLEVTAIVKNGVLRRGDAIRTATATGKIKILENFLEKAAPELAPSAPAVIIGFDELPKVGEEFTTSDAANAGEKIVTARPNAIASRAPQVPLTDAQRSNILNLILKASDAGSLEALSVVLKGVGSKSIADRGGKELSIIEETVGDITDGDVKHAIATGATIIGFKNRVEKGARMHAEAQSVTIITSEIVYDLAKAVEDFLSGKNGPAAAGELEVLAVFSQDKLDKQLVGGRVTNGTMRPKTSAEVIRGIETVSSGGRVLGLREKKLEIMQAEKGKEIGLLVSASVAVQVGDKIVIRK